MRCSVTRQGVTTISPSLVVTWSDPPPPTLTIGAITTPKTTVTAEDIVVLTPGVLGGTAEGAVTYQWQEYDGTNFLSASGTSTLRTYSTTRANAGTRILRVMVTRESVSAVSASITITWEAKPAPPAVEPAPDPTVTVGAIVPDANPVTTGTIILATAGDVGGTATGITAYQWQRYDGSNWVDESGVQGPTRAYQSATVQNIRIRVQVTKQSVSAISTELLLRWIAPVIRITQNVLTRFYLALSTPDPVPDNQQTLTDPWLLANQPSATRTLNVYRAVMVRVYHDGVFHSSQTTVSLVASALGTGPTPTTREIHYAESRRPIFTLNDIGQQLSTPSGLFRVLNVQDGGRRAELEVVNHATGGPFNELWASGQTSIYDNAELQNWHHLRNRNVNRLIEGATWIADEPFEPPATDTYLPDDLTNYKVGIPFKSTFESLPFVTSEQVIENKPKRLYKMSLRKYLSAPIIGGTTPNPIYKDVIDEDADPTYTGVTELEFDPDDWDEDKTIHITLENVGTLLGITVVMDYGEEHNERTAIQQLLRLLGQRLDL